MKAYDAGVFYPAQKHATDPVGDEDGAKKVVDERYSLPKKNEQKDPDSGEDDQIREMENLLAEIGADVSELKVSDK